MDKVSLGRLLERLLPNAKQRQEFLADKDVPRWLNGLVSKASSIYDKVLDDGGSERFAMMLALQSPPRAMTDREFLQGFGRLGDQFAGNEWVLKKYLANARKRGYNIGENSVYMSSLADEAGDPEAFVPHDDARGHVRRVLNKRGWKCEGAVNTKGGGPPLPRVRMAESLIREKMRTEPAAFPELRKLKRPELREHIISKYTKPVT